MQVWDSIDDWASLASSIPSLSVWSSQNTCGGIEVSDGDANVWKDVTTTGNGVTASNCSANLSHCSFKDKISGMEWHKADSTSRSVSTAITFCDSLSYNGKTDWRLPTQKELASAVTHGLVSTAGVTNWIALSDMQLPYCSATTNSSAGDLAHAVTLTNGASTSQLSKFNTCRTMCVRP